MKLAIIFVLYKTPVKEIARLKKEIALLNLPDYNLYFIDNTNNQKGYATGVNKGIKKGLKDNCDIFIVANPDISFPKISNQQLLDLIDRFDIAGFSLEQDNQIYYGGEIDQWAGSGGLIKNKSTNQYQHVDFVSGSFMIISRKVIEKIGYFDEEYFMYYEEVDYCLRAQKAGFRIGINSQIKYKHLEISKNNKNKNELLLKSYSIFISKNGTWFQKLYFICKRLLNSPFIINFMSLNLSSVIIKLLHFLNFIFLIKFLNASEYGIYTLVWAQVLLLSPLLDFGTTSYSIVNIHNEKKHSMQSLFNFRFFISIFIFLLTVLLSILFFKGNTKVYIYILVTSTIIFTNTFSGSYFIFNALKNRIYISSRNSIVFNTIVVFATILSLFIFKRLLYVFVCIFIIYNLYTFINIFLIKKELQNFKFRINLKEWLTIFKQSYIYVLISFFAGLYFKIDVFLLTALKGVNEVGIYSAGYKFFDSLLFIAASYSVTATPLLAKLLNDQNSLFKKIKKDIFFLLLIGILAVFGIWFIAPIVLPLFLKTAYSSSKTVLNIVILTLPLILLNTVFMNLLYVFKKAYLVIFMFAFQSIINATLNLIFIPKYSYIASAWITVVSELINAVFFFLIILLVWNKMFATNKNENKR